MIDIFMLYTCQIFLLPASFSLQVASSSLRSSTVGILFIFDTTQQLTSAPESGTDIRHTTYDIRHGLEEESPSLM